MFFLLRYMKFSSLIFSPFIRFFFIVREMAMFVSMSGSRKKGLKGKRRKTKKIFVLVSVDWVTLRDRDWLGFPLLSLSDIISILFSFLQWCFSILFLTLLCPWALAYWCWCVLISQILLLQPILNFISGQYFLSSQPTLFNNCVTLQPRVHLVIRGSTKREAESRNILYFIEQPDN